MNKEKIRKWCYFNIILPGTVIINDDNNSTPPIPPGPTCHMPAGPGFGWLLDTPFLIILLISIGIITAVGGILLYKYFTRREVLKKQYERDIISKQEYHKMK